MKIGFFGILTLIFITLKLMNIISWSWWLVLLPAYGGLVLFLLFIMISFAIVSIAVAKINIKKTKWI
jgi:hypothetical protein